MQFCSLCQIFFVQKLPVLFFRFLLFVTILLPQELFVSRTGQEHPTFQGHFPGADIGVHRRVFSQQAHPFVQADAIAIAQRQLLCVLPDLQVREDTALVLHRIQTDAAATVTFLQLILNPVAAVSVVLRLEGNDFVLIEIAAGVQIQVHPGGRRFLPEDRCLAGLLGKAHHKLVHLAAGSLPQHVFQPGGNTVQLWLLLRFTGTAVGCLHALQIKTAAVSQLSQVLQAPEPDMGIIQQTYPGVIKPLPEGLHQHVVVSDIGQGDMDGAVFRQQLRGSAQHCLRIAQMLQHIGADNGVEAHILKLLPPAEGHNIVTQTVFGILHGFLESSLLKLHDVHPAIQSFLHIAGHSAGGAAELQHRRTLFNFLQDHARGGIPGKIQFKIILRH